MYTYGPSKRITGFMPRARRDTKHTSSVSPLTLRRTLAGLLVLLGIVCSYMSLSPCTKFSFGRLESAMPVISLALAELAVLYQVFTNNDFVGILRPCKLDDHRCGGLRRSVPREPSHMFDFARNEWDLLYEDSLPVPSNLSCPWNAYGCCERSRRTSKRGRWLYSRSDAPSRRRAVVASVFPDDEAAALELVCRHDFNLSDLLVRALLDGAVNARLQVAQVHRSQAVNGHDCVDACGLYVLRAVDAVS